MAGQEQERNFMEINETGHVQELERNFSFLSILSLGVVTGNTWAGTDPERMRESIAIDTVSSGWQYCGSHLVSGILGSKVNH
jgi:hypothetical protein